MAEWIKVSERLPKPFEEAIVYRGKYNIISVDVFNGKSWEGDEFFEKFKVTHWMPLPPQPTETELTELEKL